MSHLNAFETEMTNQEALIRALIRMGINRNAIEVHTRAQPIVGYHGTEDAKVGHIIVRARAARIPSDIGWEKQGASYVSHVDEFDYTGTGWVDGGAGPGSPIYNKAWQTNLLNFYNMEQAKMGLEARGIAYTEDRDEQNRLRLRAKFSKQSSSLIKTRS